MKRGTEVSSEGYTRPISVGGWTHLMVTLAEELRRLRDGAGLNPTELERRSGVKRSRIYDIESGKTQHPTSATLEKLAIGIATTRSGRVDPDQLATARAALLTAGDFLVEIVGSESQLSPSGGLVGIRLSRLKSSVQAEPPELAARITNAMEAVYAQMRTEREELDRNDETPAR